VPFTHLRTYNFRNLENRSVPVDAEQIFLIGGNGQGKTNFLEAIYYICYASSFRTRRDDVMKRNGTDQMAIAGEYDDDSGRHEILVEYVEGKKRISIDDKTVRDRKELVSAVSCVVFCHDDIQYVTGPPEMQRWFVNQSQTLISDSFVDQYRRYRRVLKTRNAALRDGKRALLDPLDHQLIETGIPLVEGRATISKAFAGVLSELFEEVFGSERVLTFSYQSSWDGLDQNAILKSLADRRNHDLEMKTSTQGPHRDRFPICMDGKPVTQVASTGQLRLVSLLMRVSQAKLVAMHQERKPVLLLDDVLLELDSIRRKRFVERLPSSQQVFFTFLPDERYARFEGKRSLTYTVKDGSLIAQS
jgi:DNA replication and repair protein RecF